MYIHLGAETVVKKKEIIAYEELGAEALYFIEVEKLPVKVELS